MGDEHDQALPDPSLWRVVNASAPEWYLIMIGVIASAADGATFPLIALFMGRLFEVSVHNDVGKVWYTYNICVTGILVKN